MADTIVGGLFGVNPQQLAQQRQATDTSRAFQFANLGPAEQAQYGAYLGGSQLGRAATGLMGGDAEMQKVTAIKQLSAQFDLTSSTGMREFAQALQPIAPNESMMAAKRADELEQSGLTRQKTAADIAIQERKVTQDEKLREALAKLPEDATEAQYLQVFRQFGSPDQQAAALERARTGRERLEDAKLRRAEIAAAKGAAPAKPLSASLQKAEDSDLAKIDNLAAQSAALAPSIKNLTKDEKGVRALDLNPSKIALYSSQNFLGRSTPESLKYAALKSAVDTAVNLQVSNEKGVQTDKDVLRFANALIAAYGRFDSEATLEALKNFNSATLKAKKNTENIIQSRRKQQKIDPYEFAPTDSETPPTREVDFSTLPKRNK